LRAEAFATEFGDEQAEAAAADTPQDNAQQPDGSATDDGHAE